MNSGRWGKLFEFYSKVLTGSSDSPTTVETTTQQLTTIYEFVCPEPDGIFSVPGGVCDERYFICIASVPFYAVIKLINIIKYHINYKSTEEMPEWPTVRSKLVDVRRLIWLPKYRHFLLICIWLLNVLTFRLKNSCNIKNGRRSSDGFPLPAAGWKFPSVGGSLWWKLFHLR